MIKTCYGCTALGKYSTKQNDGSTHFCEMIGKSVDPDKTPEECYWNKQAESEG